MEKKIIIIDDNEQDRKIMQRFLNKAGFSQIIVAESGNEGLKKVKEEKPDLVILDTMLPDGIGFDFCQQIRELYDSTAVKIIITTGAIDAVDALKARRAGADDYCAKLADCSLLLEAVKEIMG